MEKDFGGIISSAIKCVLLATDHTWISDASKVNSKSVVEILTKKFVENLSDTVDCFWLQNTVIWCLILLKGFTTKRSNSGWNKYLTIIISGKLKSICTASNINIIG